MLGTDPAPLQKHYVPSYHRAFSPGPSISFSVLPVHHDRSCLVPPCPCHHNGWNPLKVRANVNPSFSLVVLRPIGHSYRKVIKIITAYFIQKKGRSLRKVILSKQWLGTLSTMAFYERVINLIVWRQRSKQFSLQRWQNYRKVIKSSGSLSAQVWLIGATIKGQFIALGLERNLGSSQGSFVHVNFCSSTRHRRTEVPLHFSFFRLVRYI